MKRFLIWGIKWTCLSLCGFALCGNMAYVAVSANSLAYDEDSSSDESYTNSNDYTENSFAESDTSVKNFAESMIMMMKVIQNPMIMNSQMKYRRHRTMNQKQD